MSLTVRVEFTDRSAAVLAGMRAAARRGVLTASLLVHGQAKRLVLKGPKTGRVYTQIFRRIGGRVVPIGLRTGNNLSPSHRASAPGQAPASDTGNLAGRLHHKDTTTDTDRPRADVAVESGAPYGIHLELGAPRAGIAPRPFLRPAMAAMRPQIVAAISAALKTALR